MNKRPEKALDIALVLTAIAIIIYLYMGEL